MVRLNKRHKAVFIKEQVINCLESYGLELQQVYSNTTDNGANVIKASKILQDEQEAKILEESDTAAEEEENLHRTIESVFSVVRCAAHTLQLAAYDVLKTLGSSLEDCRTLIKKVRTLVRTESSHMQMPVLDNLTRWNSTYEMLTSLQKIKEFIEQQCPDSEDFHWEFVVDFNKAFKPLALCTKRMQSEQYVVGDFYRDWLSCELELHDLGSTVSYAAQLHDAMKSRKQSLMSNNAFIAALYLDPRFNFRGSLMLSPQQKVNAENHLIKTYENMLRMESSENSMSSSPQNLNLQYSECLPSTSSNSFSRLEKYICEDMVETSSDVE
ncbi:uncharacterized protein LOC118754132, partial [Rhagoletis pomonella]|uniref:uncharacterized protein LOC118754109 n=1 Tax=Rhagoletis pomonella TaxID=28610 RepID=UPI00177DEE46